MNKQDKRDYNSDAAYYRNIQRSAKTSVWLVVIVAVLALVVVPFPLVLLGLLIWVIIKLPKSLAKGAQKDAEMIKGIVKTAKQMKEDIK